MKKTKLTRSLLAAVSIVALSAVMYGCTHDGDDSPPPVVEPEPTAYEAGKAAIMAATTEEAAQAAYDAVDQTEISGQEAASLQAALASQLMALDTAAREAAQKMALMTAAGMIDTSDLSTQEAVDAARAAIVMLRGALAAAADVSDADRAMYMSMLDDAVMAVDAAQGGIDTATRRMNQMTALSGASDTLQAALAALSGSTPTQAQLDAANNALAALNTAIADGADLTDDEKARYQHEADNAAAPINMAQMAFDEDEDEDEKAANAAMAITAAKLHKGIAPQTSTADAAPGTALQAGERAADYNNVDTPSGTTAAVDTNINVGIGTAEVVALTEDKKTMVADLHGWEGKRYTAEPDDDGMYEAVVYSNVGEPTMGAKFNSGDTGENNVGFATTDGTLALADATNLAARIASPSFDHSAGYKTFKLPENNPSGSTMIPISGSYYGVAGTYSCTPTVPADGCRVNRAADGYTLALTGTGGGTWTFKATNPEARVTEMPDAIYASYGWWIHKSADDSTYTASAFVDDKGNVPDAADLDTLQGSATYMGGAAGKYALSSSTGGTNDAGHFTARATLEADFSDNSITGTIDQFMGADGMSRDWSVELKEAAVAATGGITRAGTDQENNDTVWTIGGTAGAASGEWSGSLQDSGDDGVPKVGTGTFYTEYGSEGRMVGAFGVNKQ